MRTVLDPRLLLPPVVYSSLLLLIYLEDSRLLLESELDKIPALQDRTALDLLRLPVEMRQCYADPYARPLPKSLGGDVPALGDAPYHPQHARSCVRAGDEGQEKPHGRLGVHPDLLHLLDRLVELAALLLHYLDIVLVGLAVGLDELVDEHRSLHSPAGSLLLSVDIRLRRRGHRAVFVDVHPVVGVVSVDELDPLELHDRLGEAREEVEEELRRDPPVDIEGRVVARGIQRLHRRPVAAVDCILDSNQALLVEDAPPGRYEDGLPRLHAVGPDLLLLLLEVKA
mmetsp:Transcript_25483/g.50849  ORF Transcript_25483/g.50849 Transcript_25483/m.50849 type:complete len:284 (-) Transcript_25483:289-1140(-)